MAAILKFCVARGILMQMLVLVSQFERLFQLSETLAKKIWKTPVSIGLSH